MRWRRWRRVIGRAVLRVRRVRVGLARFRHRNGLCEMVLSLVVTGRVRRRGGRGSVGVRSARRLRRWLWRVSGGIVANICVSLGVVLGMSLRLLRLVGRRIVRLRRMDIVGVGGLLNGAAGSGIGAVACQLGRGPRGLESLLGVGCTVGRSILLRLLTMRLASARAVIRHDASFNQRDYGSLVHRVCRC